MLSVSYLLQSSAMISEEGIRNLELRISNENSKFCPEISVVSVTVVFQAYESTFWFHFSSELQSSIRRVAVIKLFSYELQMLNLKHKWMPFCSVRNTRSVRNGMFYLLKPTLCNSLGKFTWFFSSNGSNMPNTFIFNSFPPFFRETK